MAGDRTNNLNPHVSVHRLSGKELEELNGQEVADFGVEIEEEVIEVPKYVEKVVEKEILVPEVRVVDVVKEVTQYREVVKEVPKYEVQEVIKEVPNIEVRYVERIVEVPQVQVREHPREIVIVKELTRTVPRVLVKEVPVETVVKVPKVIWKDIEKIEFVEVPQVVQVKKERPVGVPRVTDHIVHERVHQTGSEKAPYAAKVIDVVVDAQGRPLHAPPGNGSLLEVLQAHGMQQIPTY